MDHSGKWLDHSTALEGTDNSETIKQMQQSFFLHFYVPLVQTVQISLEFFERRDWE